MTCYHMIFKYNPFINNSLDRITSNGTYECDRITTNYYTELMRDVLEINQEQSQYENMGYVDTHSEQSYDHFKFVEESKRKWLYNFLENNKDKGQYEIDINLDVPATFWVRFIDYLQGDTSNIKDSLYIHVIFIALRYGCLKLIQLDDRVFNILIEIFVNPHKYKSIKTSLSLIQI